MSMIKKEISIFLICFIVLSFPLTSVFAEDSEYYNETFRNQFHFSPEANWMNDPNGMVYYEGEYHLFYQHHPYGTTWGPMHWGHAVSEDLVHWEHLPIALSPDENGDIFSGSAVIDWNNTAGFGKEAMVAIFTHSGEKGQVQSLAYSLDKGRTWEKYEGNPVMPNPPIPDWRDPKVFWHKDSSQWVMSLAAKNKVMFYTSPNLKDWEFASEFGPDGGIQANSLDRISYSMSEQSGGSFSYEGNITLNEKNGREGAGGLVFHADKSAKNGYVANLDAKNDVVTLSKNEEGVTEEIARKPFTLETSRTYHVKVDMDGDQIKVSVNDQPVIEANDLTFESGYYGLSAWNSTAAFRKVEFENKSNFVTNLSKWKVVNGSWEDTLDGKSGSSTDDAFIMSGNTSQNLIYEADLTISGDKGGNGAGALVFRADADAKNGYFANIDVLNDTMKLMKIENGKISVITEKAVSLDTDQTYHLKVRTYGENIKVYLDHKLIHDINDTAFSSGYVGLNTWNSSTIFQDVQLNKNIVTNEKELINHDFETGDLTGWRAVSGNAFTNDHVTTAASYWGGPFGHEGNYHLWGFSDLHNGDDATGELHSSYFKLGGTGEINFLLGGGNDINNRYVSLVRASDNKELIRQANTKFNEEKYNKYVWDASDYIGEVLYIKVVDQALGGWGHINVDDVHVYNEGSMPAEVDNVAKEPVEGEVKQSGTITEWSAVSGEWIPSTNGSNGGIWECPALVELPIDGDPTKTKWVLQVSINDGAPAGGSGMQYFVGSFDGKTFKNENPTDQVLWTDYGADFYAAVEWSGIEGENSEKYWLGWMSNWQYANNTPTSTWRSSMSLPRKMELTQTEEGLRLKQTPVSIDSIRDNSQKVSFENKVISNESHLLDDFSGDTFEMIAEFDVSSSTASEFGFEVRKGSTDEFTKIGYDVANQKLFVDRTNSDSFDYGNNVVNMHEGPLPVSDGTVKMHIFVDRSAVEVFGNNGETVITDQIFPSPTSNGVKIYSKDGNVALKSLNIFPVESIWKKSGFQSTLNGWKTINGNWADTIAGKQGQSNGDAFILSNEAGSNFKYQADIKILDTDSHPNDPNKDTVGNLVGAGALVFRSDSKGKNAYAVNVDGKNNVVKLIKFVNGVGHDIASFNNDGNLKLQANEIYHLKVVTAGDNIKAYLDDKLVIDTNDQTYKEGYFGLNVWDSTVVFNHVKNKDNKIKK
ncbi:levanase [Metabacillus sediminilitoris]|uniref:Levanase n=1 Tax=Metabacillus sediminilitoris TaxID=2567941 RepID=A0A4S4BRT0_9BACI|nr:glycoside hydrolase family 32 protein [Metabacillus sediminilitoris]QGQ45430.1 levanase [Metabacillus sediminilitoris]THF77713.1 levanase [Metabacillus sediminilitoris]